MTVLTAPPFTLVSTPAAAAAAVGFVDGTASQCANGSPDDRAFSAVATAGNFTAGKTADNTADDCAAGAAIAAITTVTVTPVAAASWAPPSTDVEVTILP